MDRTIAANSVSEISRPISQEAIQRVSSMFLYLPNLFGTGSFSWYHYKAGLLYWLLQNPSTTCIFPFSTSLFCFFFSVWFIPALSYAPPSFASRGKCNSGSKLLIARFLCRYISFSMFFCFKKVNFKAKDTYKSVCEILQHKGRLIYS